jgi:RNA polymerase sigma-70 factor (ECF subfamily)
MDPRTQIGGKDEAFRSTCWSMILQSKEADEETCRVNLERLVRTYWKPAYGYIRRKWGKSNEDAKDLTQAFFADLFNRPFLEHVSPEKGRFRTFLRTCLENFLRNEYDRGTALKRGGDKTIISLDFISPDGRASIDPPDNQTPEEIFDREWEKAAFQAALKTLEEKYGEEGRPNYHRVFQIYYLNPKEKVSYGDVAKKLGIKETDVTNYLNHARSRFGAILEEIVRETVSEEALVHEEMAHLFGRK